MAECKVLKLSSHLAPSSLLINHHQPALSHQRPSSTQTCWHSSILLVIITCLPHTPASTNAAHINNRPPPFHLPPLDPCWSHQLVSLVVVMLVIIMSLVVITTASRCARLPSHSWTSNQHRRPTWLSTSLKIEF